MALNRSAGIVLANNPTVSANTNNAGVDDLDKMLRCVLQIVVTGLTALSTWTPVLKASADGVTFFEIARGTAGQIAANGTYVLPIHSIGDGIEAAASVVPFANAATALGAGAYRPGVPFRALKLDFEVVVAGSATFVGTLYAVNEQSASQGMG